MNICNESAITSHCYHHSHACDVVEYCCCGHVVFVFFVYSADKHLTCIQCCYCFFDCSVHITDNRNLHRVSHSSHPVNKRTDTALVMSGKPNKIMWISCFVIGFNISLVVWMFHLSVIWLSSLLAIKIVTWGKYYWSKYSEFIEDLCNYGAMTN